MTPGPPPVDVAVTPAELRRRPLPDHGAASTKQDRGVVLVVGGSAETPGAVLLAGLAALRVGAGKLQLATVASAAAGLALAVPEARVIPLPVTAGGAIDPEAGDLLARDVAAADAVVVGTGALDVEATGCLLRRLVPSLGDGVLVVDAGAIPLLAEAPEVLLGRGGRSVVMPNGKEMAALLGWDADEVAARSEQALRIAVERLGVTVTLRQAETLTASPGSPIFRDGDGNAGLATSGSGDVLAGAVAGLASRGADPLTATLWATRLHAAAGDRCAARLGGIGYLARELLDELSLVLRTLTG